MPRPSQQEIVRNQMSRDVVLNSASRRSSKPYFNTSLYPNTSNCQVLDAQISKLRSDKDDVYQGKMYGSKKEVKNLLMNKEIQFENQMCSQKLENESVYGSVEMQQDEYKKAEQRIIAEANKKRQVMLLGGAVVLLVGLAIFVN